jgi:hydrogenase nickel incorporation protein HypA/HybF
MHEVGIARSIIDSALDAVPEGGTLTGVTVSVGPLSAVSADALRFGFEVASKETPAEQATLEVLEVPLVVRCESCGTDSTIEEPTLLRCPVCDGDVTVVSGHETLMTSIRYDDG